MRMALSTKDEERAGSVDTEPGPDLCATKSQHKAVKMRRVLVNGVEVNSQNEVLVCGSQFEVAIQLQVTNMELQAATRTTCLGEGAGQREVRADGNAVNKGETDAAEGRLRNGSRDQGRAASSWNGRAVDNNDQLEERGSASTPSRKGPGHGQGQGQGGGTEPAG